MFLSERTHSAFRIIHMQGGAICVSISISAVFHVAFMLERISVCTNKQPCFFISLRDIETSLNVHCTLYTGTAHKSPGENMSLSAGWLKENLIFASGNKDDLYLS